MIAGSPLIEELRRMPTDKLEETAAFIDTLVAERHAKRNAMIEATAGSLGEAEGKALEAALEECERIDENAW
jgi:hypothetical protein